MSSAPVISPLYRTPVQLAIALQAIILVLSSAVLDFGETRRFCGITLVAFWVGTALIVRRRRFSPTPVDLNYIRGGYLALLLVAIPVITSVWRLRGVWY